MKLQLQLFIEGSQIELHDNESVTLTQTLQDILDIQKVFTDFTRTFNVPASKTNNKVFKHFYNPEVSVQDFRPKERKAAVLFLNHQPFKTGFVKYDSVQMVNNEPKNYRITFFGDILEIKDLFGDLKLEDLTIINDGQTYDGSTVISTMQDGVDYNVHGEEVPDTFIYPIITHTDRLIYNSGDDTAGTKNLYVGSNSHGLVFDQLKPALRVHAIILAIQKQFNIKFSNDFFVNTNAAYYNLYLWMQKEKGSIIDSDAPPVAALYNSSWRSVFSTFDGKDYNKMVKLKGDPNAKNGGGFFVTGSQYTNINNYRGSRFMVLDIVTSSSVKYTVQIRQAVIGSRSIFFEQDITSVGTDRVIKLSDQKELQKGASYHIFLSSTQSATFTVTMAIFDSNDAGGNYASAVNTFTTNATTQIVIKDQMPDIKCIDFVTSIFKMFNLTSFKSGDEIKVQPLDDFYSSSTTRHDITEHLDVTDSEVTLPIPYDNIEFKYKGNETFFTAFHNERNGINWGHLQHSLIEESTNKEYKIELPFEHMKFERILNSNGGATTDVQWGWSVNRDQESLLTKPLLFYAHKITSGTAIGVLPSSGGSVTSITSYYVPSNLSDPTTNTTQSIHWGAEKNEYTFTNADTSLFSTYYKNYITEVFDDTRRIFKFKAYLPMSILLNLQLNDRIIIFNTSYKINKIVTNFETGLSNLELLNEVGNNRVPTDNVISDVVKTTDQDFVTADTTLVRADTTIFRI